MRTRILVDKELVTEAMRATGARTEREAVELGLRTLLRLAQQQIRSARGRLPWSGDLDASRRGP